MPLAARYGVVVANPPYMGGANMNKWVGRWAKQHYPDAARDLCTCFIERGIALADEYGFVGMLTASSWMFISSFEGFRKKLLASGSICSMIQQSTHGFPGVTVPTTMFVYAVSQMGIEGAYIRLEDFDRPQLQEAKALEALADPDCGWFYRRGASAFGAIPGSPIAYWISEGLARAFKMGQPINTYVRMPYGFKTGDNDRFLRLWWECGRATVAFTVKSDRESASSGCTWFSYNKGGSFRKWFGNNSFVMKYRHYGCEVLGHAKSDGRSAADYDHNLFFKPVVTWSRISSGVLHMRYSPCGAICDMTGSGYYGPGNVLAYLQAFCNSAIARLVADVLSPTLDFQPGQIGAYPIVGLEDNFGTISPIVEELRLLSQHDWDACETACGFIKHPLL